MSQAFSPFQPWLGTFETLRVQDGRALLVEEHWERLNEAATALGLRVPIDFRAVAATLPKQTGRWRWIVSSIEARPLFAEESFPEPEEFTLTLTGHTVGADNWDARHKTFSYLTHWQARQAALADGADEALLLNEKGHLASGAMTNLFWVRHGVLHTPDVAAGCRNGVVRGWVMARREARTVHASLDDLLAADEIFVTNSLIGVVPVVRLNDRKYLPGPIALDLAFLYRRTVLA